MGTLNFFFGDTGFNRNIVECKLVPFFRLSSNACVLIETLWNVNRRERQPKRKLSEVLIETLWNVNRRIPIVLSLKMMF